MPNAKRVARAMPAGGRNTNDFKLSADYWNNKNYGHVAPDGSIHPRRAFDRHADAEEAAGRPRPSVGEAVRNLPRPRGW